MVWEWDISHLAISGRAEMVSKSLVELGERMTTNYLVVSSSRSLEDVRAALGRIQVAEKLTGWSSRLVLDSSTDTALYFSYGTTDSQSWHATVKLYPVTDRTFVVADIDKWTEVLDRGTFKSTVYVDESKSMESFFDSVSAAIRSVDSKATVTLSSELPSEVRSQAVVQRTDDPTPTDVRAGAASSNRYRDVLIGADGKPLWDDADGDVRVQWPISIYGHRKAAPGAMDFVDDESLFPATRYLLKDLRGVLYATACRLVVYFPFGRNGFMFGTPNTDGYVRAGHLRYQWISQVAYSNGRNNYNITSMLSVKGRVTLAYSEVDGTRHRLTLLLDADPPLAEPVAQRVKQLVTQFRLGHAGDGDPSSLREALDQPFRALDDQPSVMAWDVPGATAAGIPLPLAS